MSSEASFENFKSQVRKQAIPALEALVTDADRRRMERQERLINIADILLRDATPRHWVSGKGSAIPDWYTKREWFYAERADLNGGKS
jgi:hypothetical protein